MSGIEVATFLQPAVQPVFDNAFKLIVEVTSKLSGRKVAKTVTTWTGELKRIQGLDVEQGQFYDNAIQLWLRDLKDVAYDMEDVLELLAVQSHEKEVLTISQKFLGCICFVHMKENLSIEEKVAEITVRLKGIQKPTVGFQIGLRHDGQQTLQTAFRSQRETTSVVPKSSGFFGRDEMKQEIITRLLRDDHYDGDKNYVMIPIVGAGGIGKTTLAQVVYNDKQVQDHFGPNKAWVCVSDVFDLKRIATSIINQVDNIVDKKGTVVDLNQALNKLMQQLTGKKFLIVLDDIWSENQMNLGNLQAALQHAAKGSKVIVTTRIENTAKFMNTNSTHDNIIHLPGLSDDACWDIVQQHANNKIDLAGMQTDIISKCNGLPLAAKILGGLFKTKDTSSECQQILKSDIWSNERNTVLPVLRLSYYHLPDRLKRVFAYCSVFPKDYRFKKMQVVLLWIALGFLQDEKLISMETIGQSYFHELVSRSLLEVDSSSQKYFTMHDLIHDLALWAAGDICHIMDTKDIMEVAKKSARHVSLTKDAATTLGSPFPMASELRTLICNFDGGDVSNIKSLDFIQKFSCMRALILRSDTIEVLPDCIWDLKLLRLLDLDTPCIKELSKLIKNLRNLQILVLKCWKLQNFPNIGSLKKLRCLDFNRGSLGEMPRGIENLTNLRSLRKFFMLENGHGSRMKELKNLNNLQGKLRICGLENVLKADDAKEVQLHEKRDLDKLSLKWGSDEEQVDDDNTQGDVLEQLKPPINIKACKLVRYMGRNMPVWLGEPSFTSMVAIKLKKLEKCERLPPLGQLTLLERLEIYSMKSIKRVDSEFYGDLFRCSNAFPALKHLRFEKMPSWEKWVHPVVGNGNAFAKLEALEIRECGLLEGDLPPFLCHLRTLEIYECKEMSLSLGSLPSLMDLEVVECKEMSLSLASLPSLVGLDVWNCEKIRITSGNSCELAYLTKLIIKHCPDLVFCSPGQMRLPALKDIILMKCENVESLPSQMLTSTSLEQLEVYNCPKLQCIPEGGLPINLKQLEIYGINEAVQESWGLHCLHSLQSLRIMEVESEYSEQNMSVPSSLCEIYIKGIKNMKNLRVGNCTNLTSLLVCCCPDLETMVGNCTSLKRLYLQECPKMKPLPQGILNSVEDLTLLSLDSIPSPDLDFPPSLRSLRIGDFQNLKSMKCSALPNLVDLYISNCPKLEEFFDDNLSAGNFTSLKGLTLEECPKLQSLPQGILNSLERLTLNDAGSNTNAVESIPCPDLDLPSSLRSLEIGGFQNLKSMKCSALPNLVHLDISNCPKFEFFDDNTLPPQLEDVFIERCRVIKQHLKSDSLGRIRVDFLDNERYSRAWRYLI